MTERKDVMLGTLKKVKVFLEENPKEAYSITSLSTNLNIDKSSMQICLSTLSEQNNVEVIQTSSTKSTKLYRWRNFF